MKRLLFALLIAAPLGHAAVLLPPIPHGSQSQIVYLPMYDYANPAECPATDVTSASEDFTLRVFGDKSTGYTDVFTETDGTLETVTTSRSYETPTATKARFEVTAAGSCVYELHLPDAAFSGTSDDKLIIEAQNGTADLVLETVYQIDMTGVTQDAAWASLLDFNASTYTDEFSVGAALSVQVPAILDDTAEIGTDGAGLTNINLPNQTMDITGDITGNITGDLSGSVGSVTGAVGSVTGAVGSVTGAVGSVTAVSTGAITAGSIAADAIGASELAADAVSEIQSGLATAAAVTTVDSVVDAIEVDTQNIQGRLPAALVTGRMDSSVGAMAADTVTASAIATDAIGAAEIADNAIDAGAIATAAIGASEIATDAIGAAEIASNAIGSDEIAADAIASSELATTAVTEVRDAILDFVLGTYDTEDVSVACAMITTFATLVGEMDNSGGGPTLTFKTPDGVTTVAVVTMTGNDRTGSVITCP